MGVQPFQRLRRFFVAGATGTALGLAPSAGAQTPDLAPPPRHLPPPAVPALTGEQPPRKDDRPAPRPPEKPPEALPKPRAEPEPPPSPYALAEGSPIDLPTALRLAEENNPVVGAARARVAEAYARLDRAEVMWLPDLTTGFNYYRLDGRTQNQRGEIFTTSRSNLFVGAGAAARFDTSEALFLPLVARRLADAQTAAARAVGNDVQLDVALAYLDLIEVYGRLAVNADIIDRTEQVYRAAKSGAEAGLNKTAADVNRMATELYLRRQERVRLEAQAAVVSARLARLLLLEPTIVLKPVDPAVVPITLVPHGLKLGDLVRTGLANRPEVSANRSGVAAADERIRQARMAPLLPAVQVDYTAGTFGGGRNSFVGDFSGRGVGTAGAVWTLENLGLGYRAEVRLRRAEAERAAYRLVDVQAGVAEEVTAAAHVAASRLANLPAAQEAVSQALEMYRKLRDSSFNLLGPRPQFDSLEPLLAVQALNQARVQYLAEVVEYNRAQFRLYTAMGNPPIEAMPKAAAEPVSVPAVPRAPATEALPDPRAVPPERKP